MITYSKVIELPDTEPVSLEEAKIHLEMVGYDDKDSLITSLIKVARRMCEQYSGLSFITQKRRVVLDRFPGSGWVFDSPYNSELILPYGPVQSVDLFKYTASDLTETDLTEDDYFFDDHSDIARLFPKSNGEKGCWPSTANVPNAVKIEYTAGYDSVSGNQDFPEEARQAILLQVGAMFENRQDEVIGSTVSELNLNSRALLDNIKVYWNANQY